MAAAAGLQNKLWPFIDIFYANQGEENSGYVTPDFLRKVGSAVRGLDVEKAMTDSALPSVQRALNEAQTEWQSNGFTGTPSFLLGPTGGRLEAARGQVARPQRLHRGDRQSRGGGEQLSARWGTARCTAR